MSNLDHQFHRAQQRIKTRSEGIRADRSRPLFTSLLTGIDAKSNKERLADYEQKLTVGVAA